MNSLLFYVVIWFLANRPGFTDISGRERHFVKLLAPIYGQVLRVHLDVVEQNSGQFGLLSGIEYSSRYRIS